jgi:NADH:ubiquinone oxidoreductase subunit F (NADH-binding)/(2Fe-2S) ferredoxin/NAD-dependent dihydropyrimidine dehydrogenase PreA subunit
MNKLRNLDEFKVLHGRLIASRDTQTPTIVVPAGTCGQTSGANDIIRIAKREILTKGLTEKIRLRITGCHGFCQAEPSILIEPDRIFYPNVKTDNISKIIDGVAKGHVITDCLYFDSHTNRPVQKQDDIPFFKHQQRMILARNEKVDPIRIYNYIEIGGYTALADILENHEPAQVIGTIIASKLRGRGGAGFPTGLKWRLLSQQPGNKGKIIICNADEGDPGAYMDRSVLEGNPHSIIEGMIIGAYATGASEGIVYVRNEYPLAIKHLIIALRQARELGILGQKIFGSNLSFDINLIRGAGAFVCGEETALIHSVEGKMGEPRQRPPYPIQSGVEGKPTLINNVETWANIPIIIAGGASAFSSIGTKNNAGTKIFSLVGKVKNTGLVEVPMGTPISKLIYDIGDGSVRDKKIKAVQTGGPSGGCIPARMFDNKIDYDSLLKINSMMGSGGMIVMDEDTCMVDVAKYFMNFLRDESCGKCLSCREGTQRMWEILDKITRGQGTLQDLEVLEELAEVTKDASMCGLGQTAANPVLSTLRYFRDEYTTHIEQRKCPARVCKPLIKYTILAERCTGCMACLQVCPVNAISGKKKEVHTIDQKKCTKCGSCMAICKFEAVSVE